MRAVKNLDYFRKNDQAKSTKTGGLISLLSIMTICYLVYTQIISYNTAVVNKDVFVSSDMDRDPTLPFHLDIVFPDCPCDLVNVMLSTGYTRQWDEEVEGIWKTPIDRVTMKELPKRKDGDLELKENAPQINKYLETPLNTTEIIRALNDGEGCRLHGKTPVRKVAGELLITTEKHYGGLNRLRSSEPEVFKKFSLRHYIHTFTFGEAVQMANIEDLFADYPEHIRFNVMKEEELWAAQEKEFAMAADANYNYYKFVKLVPHIFVDDTQAKHAQDFKSYSYSITANKKETERPEASFINFLIDFSPISMKITRTKPAMSTFLINLCAIVGGVFVIFGLLNGFLLGLQKQVNGK